LLPQREENADDAVAGSEAGHAGPDLLDRAGTVGGGDDRQFLPGIVAPLDDEQVAIVERRRRKADQHLAGPRSRQWPVDQPQAIEDEAAAQFEDTHLSTADRTPPAPPRAAIRPPSSAPSPFHPRRDPARARRRMQAVTRHSAAAT